MIMTYDDTNSGQKFNFVIKKHMPQKKKYTLPPLEPEDGKTPGERIRKLRKRHNLTQQELAELIGIRRQHVTEFETGKLHLNDEMIIRFAMALKVTPNDILGYYG